MLFDALRHISISAQYLQHRCLVWDTPARDLHRIHQYLNEVLWQGDGKGVNRISTVFMGVDNGVDNGSPPRLLHGHRVSEGGQLGGQ